MRGFRESGFVRVAVPALLLLVGAACPSDAPRDVECSQESGLIELIPMEGGGSEATLTLSNPGDRPVFASLGDEAEFTLEGTSVGALVVPAGTRLDARVTHEGHLDREATLTLPDVGGCGSRRWELVAPSEPGPSAALEPADGLVLEAGTAVIPGNGMFVMQGDVVVRNVGGEGPEGALHPGTRQADGSFDAAAWTLSPGPNTQASELSIRLAEGASFPDGGLLTGQELRFQVTLHPSSGGPKSALLTFHSNDPEGDRALEVSAIARASCYAPFTDVLEFPREKADVVVVIDESPAMQPFWSDAFRMLNGLVAEYAAGPLDYRIAFLSADLDNPEREGPLLSFGPTGETVFTRQTENRTEKVHSLLEQVWPIGSATSQPLAALVEVLSGEFFPVSLRMPAIALRPDAKLRIVVVTASLEASPGPVAYYVETLTRLKGDTGDLTIDVIGPFDGAVPGDPGCVAKDDGRLQQMVAFTGGLAFPICRPGNYTSESLTKPAEGPSVYFWLTHWPDPVDSSPWILRRVGDGGPSYAMVTFTERGSSLKSSLSYDATENALVIGHEAMPSPGERLEVTYPAPCGR